MYILEFYLLVITLFLLSVRSVSVIFYEKLTPSAFSFNHFSVKPEHM